MIIDKKNKSKLLHFLIFRWQLLITFAAIERIYIFSHEFSAKFNTDKPDEPPATVPEACLQIDIIKKQIIKIIPEAHFIDYRYEAQAPLDPEDFMEIFMADHYQCIKKVEDTIKRLRIQ